MDVLAAQRADEFVTADGIPELKAKGCFTEIIAYKTRVFVPTDRAEAILECLIAYLE